MSKTTRCPFVVFMYLLLRDELPAGKVERLLKEAMTLPANRNPRREKGPLSEERELSSEHLGLLAEEMCERLGIDTWVL